MRRALAVTPLQALPYFSASESRTPMNFGRCRFRDLDTAIDLLHGRVQEWVVTAEAAPHLDLDAELLHRLELAAHEWLANLIQHADFGDRPPEIALEVWHDEHGLHGVIEDNSAGFDLDGHLALRAQALEAFPERGMGLLMLRACTTDLVYARSSGWNRLTFRVSQDQDPWLDIPFV